MKKNVNALAVLIFSILGVVDAAYLTYEHFSKIIPPCSSSIFLADCGKVLNSSYSLIFGVPLAVIGLAHYSFLLLLLVTYFIFKKRISIYLSFIESAAGCIASLYFVYLQIFVIKALCLYCVLSAVISFILFFLIITVFSEERKRFCIWGIGMIYRNLSKNIFFLLDPEKVHTGMTLFGETAGSLFVSKAVTQYLVYTEKPILHQVYEGIEFKHPIGLSAGFDYEARLTRALSPWGFGFQTVGTITNKPYEGNPGPMLGRLPQSKSLMVNKGFKNDGAKAVIKKLNSHSYKIPVGISIGRTNSPDLTTQKESIKDIISALSMFERSRLKHSYYEINISCPNLFGDITFYPPKNLEELLREVDKLHIKRPVFMKMPIEKSNEEVAEMLHVIADHCPKGVIFGNLQKDRKDPQFVQSEVRKFRMGNFSGKPTYQRSNELIELAYKNYHDRFIIVGCGGIFNATDAYEKIKRGASLLQLITGMIFQGPQLIMQINLELADLLKRDGFYSISEAVGYYQKK